MKDVLDQDISIGDTVCMARRYGNSAQMAVRKVVDLEDKDYSKSVKVEAPSGRTGWTSPNNLVVVSEQIKKKETV